jgi:hypothetical protein
MFSGTVGTRSRPGTCPGATSSTSGSSQTRRSAIRDSGPPTRQVGLLIIADLKKNLAGFLVPNRKMLKLQTFPLLFCRFHSLANVFDIEKIVNQIKTTFKG